MPAGFHIDENDEVVVNTLVDPRDKSTRHLPRHKHYLADAQLLIRRLQALAWPHNFHITLGGGVLNHGYSNKDIDIYVLPIYPRKGDGRHKGHDVPALLASLKGVLGAPVQDYRDVPSMPADIKVEETCFAESLHFEDSTRAVDLFIVKP